MIIKMTNKLHCKRCGHKWNPRNTEIRMCPKCKSPWWDVKKNTTK